MATDDARGRSPGRRLRGAAPWLLLVLAALVGPALAPAQGLDEPLRTGSAAHVEAAYLVNFLRFAEWPATATGDPGAPLVISVVGSEQAVEVVREVVAAAGPVAGRPVEVQDVDYRSRRDRDSRRQQRARAELRASHLVFVDRSAAGEVGGVVHDLLGLPVLTVANVEGFIAAGGMLELVPAGRNIVFAASPGAIQRAGLVLSAKVLKLARLVEDPP